MKVIELLNKIANGEEVPKIIKYDETIYLFRNYDYKEYSTEKGYCDEQTSWIEDKFDFYKINDEVEIIEDKKIEKIELTNGGLTLHKIIDDIDEDIPINSVERTLVHTINEIIDYLGENK